MRTRTTLYPEQQQIHKEVLIGASHVITVSNGRRNGKTHLAKNLIKDVGVVLGQPVIYLAPGYSDFIKPIWKAVIKDLAPMIDKVDSLEKSITFKKVRGNLTQGSVKFWTSNDENAGRGTSPYLAIFDEAAHSGMVGILDDLFYKAVQPALADRNGKAIFFSTPTGIGNAFHDLYIKGINGDNGYKSFNLPTQVNPFISKDFLTKRKKEVHPLVWRQEYLAEFIEEGIDAFFDLNWFEVVPDDKYAFEYIYAMSDTAFKTGPNNDGTAVILFGYDIRSKVLCILDWDKVQVRGDLLDTYFGPKHEKWEEDYGDAYLGLWIEDKASGQTLSGQLSSKYHKINLLTDEHWVNVTNGKDTRSVLASNWYVQGKVKITQSANDKQVVFKKRNANHLKLELKNYLYKGKNNVDDLIDCLNYGVIFTSGLLKQTLKMY